MLPLERPNSWSVGLPGGWSKKTQNYALNRKVKLFSMSNGNTEDQELIGGVEVRQFWPVFEMQKCKWMWYGKKLPISIQIYSWGLLVEFQVGINSAFSHSIGIKGQKRRPTALRLFPNFANIKEGGCFFMTLCSFQCLIIWKFKCNYDYKGHRL